MNLKSVSGYLLLAAVFCAPAHSATISGRTIGPEHHPLSRVFVAARLQGGHRTYYVQSDASGLFSLPNLPQGSYAIRAEGVGVQVAHELSIHLQQSSSRSIQLVLNPKPIVWKDLSIGDWRTWFPDSSGRQDFERHCFTCHGYQNEVSAEPRDTAAWAVEMKRKRTDMAFWLSRMNDNAAASILDFLDRESGHMRSTLSAAEEARYEDLRKSQSSVSSGLIFVEYDIAVPSGSPWSANPDNRGNVWIPLYGHGNAVERLQAKDGSTKIFPVGTGPVAGIHSVVPTADGAVWLTEFNRNRIARLDPNTGKYEEFQVPPGESLSNSRNSVAIDKLGNIWSTGSSLARFDVATTAFQNFTDVPKTYGLSTAENGDVWFTAVLNSSIGMFDHKNGQICQWQLPHHGTPQHIETDGDGNVYFSETAGGKIIRFTPATEVFTDFPLPGSSPSPYALAIDRKHRIWYSSTNQDAVGYLDPATRSVKAFEFPHSEAFIRELKMDEAGRVWYTSPSNHVVGYFYLPDGVSPSNSHRGMKNADNGVHP
jgi:virginiamycin B lyase